MKMRLSLISRSSTPHVKAPWEPPPWSARLMRLRPLCNRVSVVMGFPLVVRFAAE
jgi:hypothetical protein